MIRVRNNNKFVSRFLTIVLALSCLFNVVSCAPSHNHSYGAWEITEEATCEDEGLRVRTCACGHKEEEVILKTKHNYVCDYGYPATFTSTGLTDGAHCSVCEEVIVAQTEIERLKEQDYGYKVEIGSDEHVSVYVYTTQDYTAKPMLSNVAFARDGSSGELLKNGDGQVNFELVFDEGYYLKDIKITSGYNALKIPEETGRDNTYRITKITNELVMFVESQKQLELSEFASITDDAGNVEFSWARDMRIDYTKVRVTVDDQYTDYVVENGGNKWTFENLDENVYYQFEFTPCVENDYEGKSTTCSRYFSPDIKSASFPRIEITTQGYVWPTCDYVDAPVGCIGSTIFNNDYVQSIVNIYDKTNELLYSSSSGSNDFSGSKVKLRGNVSAYYGEKKPFKIKLNKKADLLAGLVPNRSDKNYAHKEWLLLKSGNSLNTLVGWSVSSTLQMDYTPAYSYVACYVNGDYRGLYILCESVSQGSGTDDKQSRCAIDDDGFIVELDAYWWTENIYFSTNFTVAYMKYTFKYPDSDDITELSQEVSYIKKYILEFEEALSKDDNSYRDYIDEESFAKWLLAHDILGTFDAGGSNIYLTKKDSTDAAPMVMSVLWDLDSVLGQNMVNSYAEIRNYSFFYYNRLLQKRAFVDTYNELFATIKDRIISNVEGDMERIDSESYNQLIEIENKRWIDKQYENYDEQSDIIISWLQSHIEFMIDNPMI